MKKSKKTKRDVQSSTNELDQKLREVSRELITKYGLPVLLDVCQGTVNKILVKKGIVTVSELRSAYTEDIQRALVMEALHSAKQVEALHSSKQKKIAKK